MVFGMNLNSLFNEMERFAKEENVPIMLKDGIDYLCNFIKDNKINSVLEIGTAIGYSALKMAVSGASVTTIERDEPRYLKAVDYVKQSGIYDRINLVFGDAFDVNIDGKFDLLFIDAAKGKNREFIEKFKTNLNKDGFIIIDNIDFHGLVGKSDEIESRNLRSLVRKIEGFLKYLDEQNEFKVTKINVGDGLILLERN